MINKKLAVFLSIVMLFCFSPRSFADGLHFGIIDAIEGKVEELRGKKYETKTAFSDVNGQTTIYSVLLDTEVHISTESADDGQALSGIQTDLYTDGETIIVVGSDPQGHYFPMPFFGSSDSLSSNTRSSKIKQQSTLGIIEIFLKLASFAGNVHSFTKNLPSWDADKVSNLPGVAYMGSASFGNVGDMLGIGSFVLYATGVEAGVAFIGSLASHGIEIAGILGVDIDYPFDWYLLSLAGVNVVFPVPSTTVNNPPNTPSSPSPADGATNQSINTDLSWSGGDPDSGDTVTYDVYFEANDSTPDQLVSNDQSGVNYDPGTLSYNTHYYWKIVAMDNHGASTSGSVWDFTTGSSPNQDPQLSNGYVDPSSGDTSTNFYYYVDYYDQDGDSPSTKQVNIDGSNHTMSLYSGSASNGRYQYGPKTLPAGSHTYYFYFTDGKGGSARLPSSGTYSGPGVSESNHDPVLSDGYVEPNPTPNYYYFVWYYDEDSPTIKQVNINGSNYTMHQHSGSASDGQYMYGPKPLSPGTHTYYFYFTDGKGGSARLPSSGVYDGPVVPGAAAQITFESEHDTATLGSRDSLAR